MNRVVKIPVALVATASVTLTPAFAIHRTNRWWRLAGDMSKPVNEFAPHLVAATSSTGGTVYATSHGPIQVDAGGSAIPLMRHTVVTDFGAIVATTS